MSYDSQNIFARIIRGEIPCKKAYEDESVLAIFDIAPAAPVHILVMPKGNYISFDDFVQKADTQTVAQFFSTVRKIAQSNGLGTTGYRLISNHGPDASQSVPHFHLHILGGKAMNGLLPGDTDVR